MAAGLIAHSVLSCLSGLSVSVTGFGCDIARELVHLLVVGDDVYAPASAINMGLAAALVTAVQATLQRQVINRVLLLNMLPLTFIGVVLSLNVFSAAALAALVPALGACLFGLCLAKLWMELADCRHKASVRESDDGRDTSNSWRWTGILSVASLTGGLLSGRCPPPGPAFMLVLLAAGVGGSGSGSGGALGVGGGEWRATAAVVTCSASLLRVGLLLLENGASAGPLPEVIALVAGGLAGLGAGNLSLRLLFAPRRDTSSGNINPTSEADRSYNTPPSAAFRRSVLAVAIASSVALAAGGPPAALAEVSRPLVAGALAAALLVALCGGLWGCTRGAEGAAGSARGAYGKVASDDREAHEVELKPFVGDDGDSDGDGGDGGRGDDDYLDEEDGYLADEGETERSGTGRRGGAGAGAGAGGGRRVSFSTLPPAKSSPSPPGGGGSGGAAGGKKARPNAAPPAKSLFSVGHTVEL